MKSSTLIKNKISLKDLSRYKIGGPVEYFLEINNFDDLQNGLTEWNKICKTNKIDKSTIFIMGEGTNILFHDKGFSGLIIKNSINFIDGKAGFIEVGAGVPINQLNDFCIRNELSGTEWSGGLPGTVGGAVFGNAGAFGGEMKDIVSKVNSFNFQTEKEVERFNKQCQFSYRNSIFKKRRNKEIIISVKLQLKNGRREEIERSINEKVRYRQERQPLELPNIGSTFKNIDIKKAPKELVQRERIHIKTDPFPVIPVAYLISLAGLKGKRNGDAMISEKHPNFIVNLGQAKATNVKSLINLVKKELKEQFGVEVETEIIKATK